jgi:hypothetical protein
MIIQINENLRIEATDGLNYVVLERHEPSDKADRSRHEGLHKRYVGDDLYAEIGYHGSLDLACQQVLRRALCTGGEVLGLGEVAAVVRAAQARITEAVQALGAPSKTPRNSGGKSELGASSARPRPASRPAA